MSKIGLTHFLSAMLPSLGLHDYQKTMVEQIEKGGAVKVDVSRNKGGLTYAKILEIQKARTP